MSTYTNTHTNHTDDTSKKWPIVIPWSVNWDGELNFVGTTIKAADLRELRQHAKALEANFNFAATDPSYTRVSDSETNVGEVVEAENLNQTPGTLTAAGAGLLDGIKTIKPTTAVGAVPDFATLTKAKLKEIATELNGLSSYANYTNYNNAGYGQYANYIAYSRGTGYSETFYYQNYHRYSEYNRAIHTDNDANPGRYTNTYYYRSNGGTYSDANTYTDQTAPGYNNGTYNNSTTAYSNAVYSNSYTNPATYQNTL